MTREEMIDLLLRNFLSMNYGKSIEQLTEGCRLERVRLSQMSDLKLQNMVSINC